MSDSVRHHRQQPTRLPRPWDSPGKNTGVGCHFLLQHMKVKSESEVVQSCLTLRDPMDCSPPDSSVHGIFQARVQEWGAIAFSDNEKRTRQNLKSPPALTISIRFKIKSMCIDLKVCLQHTCFTEQVINTADVLPLKYFGSKVICSMFISALTQ